MFSCLLHRHSKCTAHTFLALARVWLRGLAIPYCISIVDRSHISRRRSSWNLMYVFSIFWRSCGLLSSPFSPGLLYSERQIGSYGNSIANLTTARYNCSCPCKLHGEHVYTGLHARTHASFHLVPLRTRALVHSISSQSQVTFLESQDVRRCFPISQSRQHVDGYIRVSNTEECGLEASWICWSIDPGLAYRPCSSPSAQLRDCGLLAQVRSSRTRSPVQWSFYCWRYPYRYTK
jgi:hypothetical protein